jgi:hypothetical protein
MKWYVVKMVFQIICGTGNHKPQFDEQLRIIEATDEDEAFNKATQLGTTEQETFYNDKQQLVQWNYINIKELYQLSLINGAELCSKIHEADDAQTYIDFVQAKADDIKNKSSHPLLQLF